MQIARGQKAQKGWGFAPLKRSVLAIRKPTTPVEWARKSVDAHSSYVWGYVHLASAYALNGQLIEARTALATVSRLRPGITIADFYVDWSNPTGNAAATAVLERQMDGLRKAGMPEGEPVTTN